MARIFQKRGNRMTLYHFAQAFAGTVAILWVILLLKERVKAHKWRTDRVPTSGRSRSDSLVQNFSRIFF